MPAAVGHCYQQLEGKSQPAWRKLGLKQKLRFQFRAEDSLKFAEEMRAGICLRRVLREQ
ncbi:MAG: hypothetical protein SFU86_16350 [Pirellulaceae bacterium]|nr:hypothetical protein [Pirellulaceae bacterium]